MSSSSLLAMGDVMRVLSSAGGCAVLEDQVWSLTPQKKAGTEAFQ
jgi:hypothetical protein